MNWPQEGTEQTLWLACHHEELRVADPNGINLWEPLCRLVGTEPKSVLQFKTGEAVLISITATTEVHVPSVISPANHQGDQKLLILCSLSSPPSHFWMMVPMTQSWLFNSTCTINYSFQRWLLMNANRTYGKMKLYKCLKNNLWKMNFTSVWNEMKGATENKYVIQCRSSIPYIY